MLDFLIFYFCFFFLLLSIIGYGQLISDIILKNNSLEDKQLYSGFIGVIFITLLSLINNLIFKEKLIINIIIHFLGLITSIFYLIKKNNRKKYYKEIFLFSLFALSMILLSKTNEDFKYYHLPITKFIYENSLVIGLSNLGHGYKLVSSLFYLNSTFVFPYVKFYLFHFIYAYFLIFFNFFCIKKIFSLNQAKIIKIFYLIAFIYFNLSFNRFAEFGTDKIGQLLGVILSIDLISKIINDDNKSKLEDYLLIFVPCLFYLITLKLYFLPWFLLFCFFVIYSKEKYIFNSYFKSNSFIISFLLLFIFFLTNLINSGCIFPLFEISCFNFFDWRISSEEINHLSLWLEFWAKAGAGPGFLSELPKEVYVKNLNWVENWYEKYFLKKVIDQLALYLFVVIFVFFAFFHIETTKKKNINFNYFIILFTFGILFFIWFLKIPQLRYNGYLSCFIFFSYIFIILFSKFKIKEKNFVKKIKIIFLATLLLVNIKNIKRIHDEFNRQDSYKFKNFPFYTIPKAEYKIVASLDNFKVHYPKTHCWDAPSPCSKEAGENTIKLLKKNNFIIIKKNK